MKATGISVIICCYNSSERIEPTLTHLFQQEINSSFQWEVIVVDNNSSDNTSSKAQSIFDSSNCDIPFKIIHEPNPGLSNARHAGFHESKFDICLMVDDDNWLANNYLEGVFNSFQSNPEIGMVGGLGIPELSLSAPNWFEKYAYCYATGPQITNGEAGFTEHLYGAGLALKLSVLDHLKTAGFTSLLTDRIGNSLMSGGDTELCFAFRMAGAKLYYNPTISFKHELPNGRVNWAYLRKLFYGFGLTKARMDIYTACIQNKPIPNNGKLPFWFNRVYFLWKKLLPSRFLLLSSRFFALEGNDELLTSVAKQGQIDGILSMRKDLIKHYNQVYQLKERLNK